MKKIYLFVCAAILSASAITVSSQNSSQTESEQFKKSRASDNWFISLGVGPNLLEGEQDSEVSIGKRLRLGGELSIGKWFNPDFGMRIQFTGGNLRGFNYLLNQGGEYTRKNRSRDPYPTGHYTGKLDMTTVNGAEGFWQDLNYGAVTLDLMANMTNLFRGYYEESPVDVIPFAGLGFVRGFESETNPSNYHLAGKLGLRANFNLNNHWGIYLEPQVLFTSDEFDGYVGNRGFDMVGSGFIGVQYTFNRNFAPVNILSREEINTINQKINDQRSLIENHQDILERQQKLIDQLNNQPNQPNQSQTVTNEAIISATDTKFLPDYIRFGLNSSTVDSSERHKVEDAADYLKANPGSKLLLIGYADKQTGNSNYNYQLSCRRVESVAKQLQNMGIASSRLITECLGDKEQPYKQNDWNRVVIMVERK